MLHRSKKCFKNLSVKKYLENEKSFLDEIKSIFHCFRGAIICEKTKINENSGHKL